MTLLRIPPVLSLLICFQLFFFVAPACKAQDTIHVSFDCQSIVLGETLCFPVRVDNFTNVTAFSLLISWDPLILRLTGIQNQVFAPNGAWHAPGPNDLRYIWGDLQGIGRNLPDGTVLFEICFRAIGVPGNSTVIQAPAFVLNPFNTTEFADPDSELIPFTSTPCTVSVTNPVTVTAILEACGSPDGVSDGSFTITGAGGTPPYTYTFTGPANGSGNLGTVGASATHAVPPGTYTITINDSAGGSAMYTITVSTAEMDPVITVIRDVTCFTFSNGRIEVGAFGGTLPISIIWKNLNNPVYNGSGYLLTTSDAYLLNSLPVGEYVITLVDARGCLREETVILDADPIIVQVTTSNATCIGTTDGSVSIAFSGGHPINGVGYRVTTSWGGGPNTVPSPLMTAPFFAPGNYWVEVCDSINGCCIREDFTIGINTVISANILAEAPTCFGLTNGRIRVVGQTNGATAGPYSIQLLNAGGVPIGSPINNVVLVQYTDVAPGMYFVIVRDGQCSSDTIPIIVPDAIPIAINVLSVTPTGCVFGQPSGTISVAATGGNPGYNYVWDGGAFSGAMITNVPAGNHTVTVTDMNGCTMTRVVNVPQATGPVIDTIIATNLTCSGGNATLEVIFTPGSSPVTTISWSTGQSTPIITGVGPGTVTVLIRDSLFCFDLEMFTVPDMGMVVIDSIRAENPLCAGDSNGQITVFVSEGLPPYTYIWSTGDTTTFNLLPGLSAGTYGVTVVDSDTCDVFAEAVVVLTDPVPPVFAFSNVTAASCDNVCDGAATLIPSGGVMGQPFRFIWESGLDETGMQSTASGLCPGYQTVYLTQDDICFYLDSVLIPAPAPVEIATSTVSDVSCHGLNDGSIMISATGGSGPYTYMWNVLPEGPVHTQLGSGSYTVTVSDSQGCTTEQTVQINEPDELIVVIDSAGLIPVSCIHINSGRITLSVSGGTGAYQYTWNPPVSSGAIANAVPSGTYSVTVTDASGCTDVTSITMSGPSPVIAFLPAIDDPACFGGLTQITVDSAIGGNGGYTWNINGGQQNPIGTIIDVPAGIYTIITQDTTGCRDTVQVFIDNPAPIEIIVLPEHPVIPLGDSIMLIVQVQGMQVPIDSVVWTNNGPLSCYDCTTPVASNVVPTLYTVTVWDLDGCSASRDVLVEVDNRRQVYIPNVFSPNFDGINDDLLLFTGQGIDRIPSMRVFDRWGELLIEQRDLIPNPGGLVVWDGTYRNKMMQPGVYVYYIEVQFVNGEVLRYHGDVTLLR